MNPVIALKENAPEPWGPADMSYLGSNRRAAPRFPLSTTLGSFWADFVERVARGASAPPDYVAAALLAVVGALLANVRWAKAGSIWTEPGVLYMCLVGSPGDGKSPAQDVVLKLLQHVEDLLAEGFEEELRAYDLKEKVARTLKANWEEKVAIAVSKGDDPPIMPEVDLPPKPERPRVRLSDTTAEKAGHLAAALRRGLLLLRDEIAGWLGSFDKYGGGGGADRAFWNEAYGGRSFTIDRMKFANTIKVPHLSIGVLGGIQPDKLAKVIGGAEDGFAARFLFVWPDASPEFELMREEFDLRSAKDGLAKLIDLDLEEEYD
jgi:Protein of unknown function (DUF3987)